LGAPRQAWGHTTPAGLGIRSSPERLLTQGGRIISAERRLFTFAPMTYMNLTTE